jgi:hypothetical protein
MFRYTTSLEQFQPIQVILGVCMPFGHNGLQSLIIKNTDLRKDLLQAAE